MIIKPKEINISQANPFAEDALERENSVTHLTNLLLNVESPYVLCVNSEWGTGKTTFLRMWRQTLINKNIPTIFFNAWENDFSDHALVALIGEIEKSIKELNETSKLSKNFIQKFNNIKKLSTKLFKKSLPAVLKIATQGLIDSDDIAKLFEKIVEDEIKQYEDSKKNLSQFKEKLTDIVSDIRNSNTDVKTPLIFFIDELDRYRPNFAVEVLEKAKHFFDIDGIIFVIAVDKEQLGYSIASIYGQGMNTDGYLRKFIDLEFKLPLAKEKDFFNYLFTKYELNDFFRKRNDFTQFYNELESIYAIYEQLVNNFKISLRIKNQCMAQFSIAIKMTEIDDPLFGFPLLSLIILKALDSKLYYNYINRDIQASKIIKFIEEKNSNFFNNNYAYTLEAYLIWLPVISSSHKSYLNSYKEVIENLSLSQEVRHRATRVFEISTNFDYEFSGPMQSFKLIINKMELLENFVNEK